MAERARTPVTDALERLRLAEARAVGASQTAKAIQRGRAVLVFVAREAERRVTEPVTRAAQAQGIEVVEVESARDLGRACLIQVGAAAAAILTPQTPGS